MNLCISGFIKVYRPGKTSKKTQNFSPPLPLDVNLAVKSNIAAVKKNLTNPSYWYLVIPNTSMRDFAIMKELLKPLKTESLVEIFIRRFEGLILSGKISIGEKLLSERELAMQLGVSRSVVHEGLIELEAKGLVKMKPRSGTIVNDYRRNGSLTLLNSLVKYSTGLIEPGILDSMLKMRVLFETETAALSALNRTDEHLTEFSNIIEEEKRCRRDDLEKVSLLDFEFHLLVSISSGNLIYPLMLNSFKEVYTNLTREFFSDDSVTEFVFRNHAKMYKAIDKKDKKNAVKIMEEIIVHGESHLKKLLSSKKI